MTGTVGIIGNADSELRDVAMRVAAAWKNSKLSLRWINPEQFEQAVVELAARFDEQANISWAQRLTENGIDVIIGIPGLKVHSKLLLIERREEGS